MEIIASIYHNILMSDILVSSIAGNEQFFISDLYLIENIVLSLFVKMFSKFPSAFLFKREPWCKLTFVINRILNKSAP